MKSALSAALASIVNVLSNPIVGAVLGLLFAFVLLRTSRASFKRIRPETAPADIAIASLSLFGRLASATLALWAYKTFANPGFKPFAFLLAGGFVVLYTIEIVRYADLQKLSRSVGPERK